MECRRRNSSSARCPAGYRSGSSNRSPCLVPGGELRFQRDDSTGDSYNIDKEETIMSQLPNKGTFETIYSGKAPWDIGKPQKPLVEVADRITGSVLDAGCGTGDTAIFLAERGCKVTGIDFLEVPIKRAREKAAGRG